MASESLQTCYEGDDVEELYFYLEHTGEHQAVFQSLRNILPAEFQSSKTRIAAGKSRLDVLGVGSGGGQLDVQILSLLQSTFPTVPITADVVEGSSTLTDDFKALVTKTANLQTVPFAWHIMHSDDYKKQVEAETDVKKFDFIHMIQMIYYVPDLDETIKFYHSLLKENGRLMIIVEIANGGWDILWKTFQELSVGDIANYRSSGEVVASVKKQGLKFEEYAIPNEFDVTECFDPDSATGQRVLNFLTDKVDFSRSFTPEVRASMLDLIKTKCSTTKDGKIIFNSTLGCIMIHA